MLKNLMYWLGVMKRQPLEFETLEYPAIQEGYKVEHNRYGKGVVLSIEQSGLYQKAEFKFVDAGRKTLLLGFAKLRVLKK